VGGLALLGTTLTSYVYVWETVSRGSEPPHDESSSDKRLSGPRIGAVVGAVFTAAILWFMLVASAATLGRHHETVTSAQDAARALAPLASSLTTNLFAVGLVTSAVVALPVLMATTAYVVGAQFDWRRGLSEPVGRARGFYGALAASLALGLAVSLAKISVIGVLVAASVIGGLGTPFSLTLLVLLARDRTVMGAQPISTRLAIAGWFVTIVTGGFGLLFVTAAALGKL
jgi:Mn2+/Fe2+ NRAMP family transporter